MTRIPNSDWLRSVMTLPRDNTLVTTLLASVPHQSLNYYTVYNQPIIKETHSFSMTVLEVPDDLLQPPPVHACLTLLVAEEDRLRLAGLTSLPPPL